MIVSDPAGMRWTKEKIDELDEVKEDEGDDEGVGHDRDGGSDCPDGKGSMSASL
jgi:hypothetical protein